MVRQTAALTASCGGINLNGAIWYNFTEKSPHTRRGGETPMTDPPRADGTKIR